MTTHLWIRAESRPGERRAPVTPDGVKTLRGQGFRVTVEESGQRIFPIADYAAASAETAPEGSWREAPREALILGLKELPDDGAPLVHRHIFFAHAFKGQPGAKALLRRFAEGGGAIYDLEYLVDGTGRRLAAFGYWAGFAGAAVSLMAWIAQKKDGGPGPREVAVEKNRDALLGRLEKALAEVGGKPSVIVIGALGRTGTGASDLARTLDLPLTRWDMAETAHGGPFPEILEHDIFLNCILARPGTPLFVGEDAVTADRRLAVIGDIACDPGTPYSPIRLPGYAGPTSFAAPVLRVHETPPLDVMAIDNLPSMLPRESSEDFASQLLPLLLAVDRLEEGPWARARAVFDEHLAALREGRKTTS